MKLESTNLKMCDVGTNAFCIETDEDQIKLATIVLAVAKKVSVSHIFFRTY